jgi:hypothetical protein
LAGTPMYTAQAEVERLSGLFEGGTWGGLTSHGHFTVWWLFRYCWVI